MWSDAHGCFLLLFSSIDCDWCLTPTNEWVDGFLARVIGDVVGGWAPGLSLRQELLCSLSGRSADAFQIDGHGGSGTRTQVV
jgi:hypothetical protein